MCVCVQPIYGFLSGLESICSGPNRKSGPAFSVSHEDKKRVLEGEVPYFSCGLKFWKNRQMCQIQRQAIYKYLTPSQLYKLPELAL